MLWYIFMGVVATIGVLVYKNSNDKGFDTTFAVLGGIVAAVSVGLTVAALTVDYHDVSTTPLQKMENGRYSIISPDKGEFSVSYKVNGLYRSIHAPVDEDESDDEVNVYLTQRKPQVVKRCSAPADWAVPFNWDWSGWAGCDTNIYIPASDYKTK